MDTLVLTQGYLPHRIVAWQRAITMSFTGKVEVVESYDEIIRSPSVAVPKPAVVRLVRSVEHREPKVRFSRANVLLRDGYRCQYCGVKAKMADLTYDHVIPRSRGGRTRWTNIVTACHACNAKKGCRTPAEARMKLRSKPVQPKWVPAVTIRISTRSVPDAWRDYVYWTIELTE